MIYTCDVCNSKISMPRGNKCPLCGYNISNIHDCTQPSKSAELINIDHSSNVETGNTEYRKNSIKIKSENTISKYIIFFHILIGISQFFLSGFFIITILNLLGIEGLTRILLTTIVFGFFFGFLFEISLLASIILPFIANLNGFGWMIYFLGISPLIYNLIFLKRNIKLFRILEMQ